jgi:hypothetical protein
MQETASAQAISSYASSRINQLQRHKHGWLKTKTWMLSPCFTNLTANQQEWGCDQTKFVMVLW